MSTDITPFGRGNDIDLNDPGSLAHHAITGGTGSNLIRQAVTIMADAQKLAQVITNTSMVPTWMRGKPDEATAVIIYGAALGMEPMTACQNIFNVQGKPAMYAKTMMAIIQRDGHKIWTEEASDESVTVAGHRRGEPDQVVRRTWTMERARKAGYTSNKRYDTNGQQMLTWKGVSEVAHLIAEDSLLGLFSFEELDLTEADTVQATITSTSEKPTGRLQAGMVKRTNPSGTDATETAETGEAPSKTAIAAMFRAFGPAGFDSDPKTDEGKAARLKYMSQILGRLVETSSDLTARDVESVTAALRQDAEQQS